MPGTVTEKHGRKIKNKEEIASTKTGVDRISLAPKSFVDLITPSALKCFPDYVICGNTYRCVWAVRDYQTTTSEQAILRHLGDKEGVTLKIYTRHVTPAEEKAILNNASKKNRMNADNRDNLQQQIVAQANLNDVAELIADLHRNREPLLHTAVYVEMRADSLEKLKEMQTDVQMELTRSKMNFDRLMLQQKEAFSCSGPVGYNAFGAQFERVMPASSAANLYPFNYSGRSDPHGLYIGRDKCGSNVIVDFDKRADDKTNGSILVLGNSGQGKSYLVKLILTNSRQQGKRVIILDAEDEYRELTHRLGGCYIDLMDGQNIINVLEPKAWNVEDDTDEQDEACPQAFRQESRLSQHISFLKDFFRSYKQFEDRHLDTLELFLVKLYRAYGIRDKTDFSTLSPTDYPILSDLYTLIEQAYKAYDPAQKDLYTEDTIRELALGLHSMCVGSDAKFFNGHTNVTSDTWVCFGVKGLLECSQNVKDAMLFNILSYLSNAQLVQGDTVAAIDELYLYLTNLVAILYIRNTLKRARKKDSGMILASQNLEDFDVDGIREYTKPLFAIPTHMFLFNGGNTRAQFYIDTLQLEPSEYELIKNPARGCCLFKSGSERYHLQVIAPEYKAALFGTAGGR